MSASIHDARICTLGEGPLWHPERQQLFWFDIIGQRLLTQENGHERSWSWDMPCSAAGWVSKTQLMVATATALELLDLETGTRETVAPLEADMPTTRANDGRADPQGGFWIGTMGRKLEPETGAIYRYYQGELRQLYAPITIPNAICFTPDGGHAYFADTHQQTVWRVALDAQGWPRDTPEIFLDTRAEKLLPDGAVVAADGTFWNAQWGAGRIAVYDPQGRFLHALPLPAAQTTCPAFGGPDLKTIFCTSAAEGLSSAQLDAAPHSGKPCRATPAAACGQAEHKVIL